MVRCKVIVGFLAAFLLYGAFGAPAAAQGAKVPWAREHRLAVSLNFGLGSISLSRYHEGIDSNLVSFQPGVTKTSDGKSNFQINTEISFRYYFPYHLLAEVGIGAIYNWASLEGKAGAFVASAGNHTMVMEVPLLIGGYYPLIDRIYVHGAIGPSFFFMSKSWWDPGPDFEADGGVGMHISGGADFMLGENFALGLELRYRMLKAKQAKYKGTNVVVPGDYDFDYSGISVIFNIRLFAI